MEDEFDLSELLEDAEAAELSDARTIKEALPIAYVLHKHDVDVEEGGQGLTAFCPFHEDRTTPAFTVFGENLSKWNCWACSPPGKPDGPGDVLDLIQCFEPDLSFVEACDRARELFVEMQDSDWEPAYAPRKRKQLDYGKVERKAEWSQNNTDYNLLNKFIAAKRKRDGQDSNRFTAEWLVQNFKIGTWGKNVVVPHYDAQGQLLTVKERRADLTGKLEAEPGSAFKDVLYNAWRTDMLDAPVLLVEGESDTWNAQYEVGDTYRVLGIPTGAMTRTSNIDLFKGHVVFIAFDADEAGRKGAERWAAYLAQNGCTVRIVPVPPGRDISQEAASLRRLCSRARAMVIAPSGISETENGYRRGSGGDVLSNWVFEPHRELLGEDGAVAYEGVLRPGGDKALITSFDLKSKSNLISWSLRNQRYWAGTDRDVAILLGMLQAKGRYLPAGSMTNVAGLHANHFVWPGDVIGPDYWTYVPPPADTGMADDINIAPGSWDPDYIHTLRDMHYRYIMDPILAWLFVAPLRSIFKEFPILAISGPHGSGKTRTMETVLRQMTGTYLNQTLTGTSPHSIMASVASTNAFPQLYDEFRNGSRDDTKKMFEQILRDAYTMQKSSKGGGGGNYMSLMQFPTIAPIVVSGEDMFSEGSHVERMIMLQIYRDGQNPEAFARANSWRNNGLPYAILTWLHRSLVDGSFARMKIVPGGPADLAPRQRINLGIIQLGWKLLQMFMEDANDSLSEPDFTMVVGELREANEHTPIEDAIYYCMSEMDGSAFVQVTKHTQTGVVECKVRVENFVSYLSHPRLAGLFPLPGGPPAIKKYLRMRYGAVERIEKTGSLYQTWLVFPFDKIAR